MTLKIVHLVDDRKNGGVNRYLDFLIKATQGGKSGEHEIVHVQRGRLTAPVLKADVIVSHMSTCWRNLPFFLALRRRNSNAFLVHMEHSYSHGFMKHCVPRRGRFQALLRVCWVLFDRIVAVSEAQAEWMLRFASVPAEKLQVISPVVDLEPFRNLLPAPTNGPINVLAIGRFHRQKGLTTLLEAWKRVQRKDLRLILAGSGPEEALLRQQAKDLKNVTFLPFSEHPEEIMDLAHIVALPSLWEPFGLVGLEARAAGRPILVSGADALPDQGLGNGLVMRGESSLDWVFALESLTHPGIRGYGVAARLSGMGVEEVCLAGWDSLLRGAREKKLCAA